MSFVRGLDTKANTRLASLHSLLSFLFLLPSSRFLFPESPSSLMIHETYSPAELASHQHRQHAKSDCGHYDSPRLKHSHSLLRSFSLRSRNNFSLRKSSPQIRVPPLASTPGNATASTDSGSSHTNSSSVWKKWRVKCITNFSTFGQDRDPAVHDTMSCPQGSARKRILPLVAVSRLVAPFQFPSSSSSSSSDDLPCVSIVSLLFHSVG